MLFSKNEQHTSRRIERISMNAPHPADRRPLPRFVRPSKVTQLLTAAVVCFAVAVIGFSAWNTLAMQQASRQNAEEYVTELTSQIAGTISTSQTAAKSTLSGVADSLEVLLGDGVEVTGSEAYLQNFLESASNSDQYDFIIYSGLNGEYVQAGEAPEQLVSQVKGQSATVMQEAKAADGAAAYVQDGNVLYACPVHRDGQLYGMAVAGINTDSVCDLVNMQIYRDQRNFSITNREGKLLLQSSDGHMKLLDDALESGNADTSAVASELERAISAGEAGIQEITLEDEDYFLSYAPVENEDWTLITLLPCNMFSGIYTTYMKSALGATMGAALVFVVLLALLVASNRKARQRLERIAYTEELTGGPNNAEFRRRFNKLRRRADATEFCIVMLDIKDFKLVNESAGFSMGDKLLKHVYERMVSQLDANRGEFAARTETDHYFVCLHENREGVVQARIDAITRAVNQNSPVAHVGFHVEFKQGACIVSNAGESIVKLQEHARLARKNLNRDEMGRCTFYNKDLSQSLYQARMLNQKAEESMRNRDFVVYLQPKVSISTGTVIGAEALVRWIHPERGFLPPSQFIPVLEESGRIQELDRYVFGEACRWLAQRKRDGKPLLNVSVNLSRAHFWNEEFLAPYVAMVKEHGLDPSLFEFEITETVFMEESKVAKVKEGIRRMHSYGFRCAVDDFGVGYSSLSLVSEMEVDTLKFDRSFFTDLSTEKARKVAHSLITMASELQMGMVIEGIETQSQIDFLANEKCDVVQGYFYSKPLPEAEFESWIAAQSRA